MFERLASGDISKVEMNWLNQLALKSNEVVTAARWKAALPHMYESVGGVCVEREGMREREGERARGGPRGSILLHNANRRTDFNVFPPRYLLA